MVNDVSSEEPWFKDESRGKPESIGKVLVTSIVSRVVGKLFRFVPRPNFLSLGSNLGSKDGARPETENPDGIHLRV